MVSVTCQLGWAPVSGYLINTNLGVAVKGFGRCGVRAYNQLPVSKELTLDGVGGPHPINWKP